MTKWLTCGFILILLACIATASAATPPTVYVDTDASGDYDCDGTDDHVQINQALAFVGSTAGYTTVHLNGSNTYWIDLTLNMYENSILQGDSDAEIKLVASAGWVAYVPMISNTTAGSTNFTIQDFIIDGNSQNNPESHGQGYYNMMLFENCDYITVNNMRLEWSLGDGLKVSNFGGYAGDMAYVTFTNNSVYKLGHDGLYCLRLNNVTAAHNDIFTRTNSGIRLSDAGNATVYNNTIYSTFGAGGSTGAGLQIDKNDGVVQKNIEIYNNTIHTMWGSGILITNEDNDNVIRGYDVHIHHNTFYDVGQYYDDDYPWTHAAITIGQSNNTIIENNIIDNGGRAGIKYYIKPAYYKIQAQFTTIVQNNIIINCENTYGPGAAIWNNNSELHNFILYNNCFYNNTELYNGTNITYSNDIYVNPLLYNESNHEYYLNSTIGTWNGTDWEVMGANSPCIDAGKSTSDYSDEPVPNGGVINIGRYGGTVYASKSVPVVTFISPTLNNGSGTVDNYVEINVSINTNSLTDFVWNWNGTNITFFNDSYILYMSFDNNSAIGENGTVVVDVSDEKNNGSFNDGTSGNWTTIGEYHGSMSFDSIDDCITLSTLNLSDGDSFIIEGYVNFSSTDTYDTIISAGQYTSWAKDGFHLLKRNSNQLSFSVGNGTAGVAAEYDMDNFGTFTDKSYYFKAEYNNDTRLAKLYIDNVLRGTSGELIGGYSEYSAEPPQIGRLAYTSAYFMNGSIDEIRIKKGIEVHNNQSSLSNLYKYNNTNWYFWSNQTGLSNGEYNYQIFANNVESDYREVTVGGVPDTKFEYYNGAAWIEDEAQYYLWFTCFWHTAECANDEQSDGQATLKITNNGTISGTPKMKLNESAPAGIRIFVDDDNTFAGAVELSNTYQAVSTSLNQDTNVTLWAWANLSGASAWEFETYAIVE